VYSKRVSGGIPLLQGHRNEKEERKGGEGSGRISALTFGKPLAFEGGADGSRGEIDVRGTFGVTP